MALAGPLPPDVVDAWVAEQMARAPEHLDLEQRRVIKSALVESVETGHRLPQRCSALRGEVTRAGGRPRDQGTPEHAPGRVINA